MPSYEVRAGTQTPLGMPAARFLADYWQKRPVLIRGAFPGFTAPLTPEDLAGLSCEEAALSRLVRHDPANDRWDVRTGPFAEDDFPGLPPVDWTLLVQDVDKWDADVAALLPHFDFLPRWRIDDVMVSFAAPGGSVGAHVDQYDVFLLQGLGRRRWLIDASPSPPTAFRDDVELKLLREFAPTHDWVLEPGDMLYLPPGVPHHGIALDACLTLSVGMRAPSQAELLVDFAEFVAEKLPDSARYGDADLLPPADPAEIGDDALERVAAALPWLRLDTGTQDTAEPMPATVPAHARAPLLRSWLGQFLTRYRSAGMVVAPPRPPDVARIEQQLARGALLVAHPFSRSAWARQGDAAELYVDGDAHPCSVDAARTIAARTPIDAATWNALDASARALLHHLCERGSVLLSPAPRRRRP